MIEITYKEAVDLYEECELFMEGIPVGEDAPLRKKADELFGRNYINSMLMVTHLVYRKLAQRYMVSTVMFGSSVE
jgi:hypothetical protein